MAGLKCKQCIHLWNWFPQTEPISFSADFSWTMTPQALLFCFSDHFCCSVRLLLSSSISPVLSQFIYRSAAFFVSFVKWPLQARWLQPFSIVEKHFMHGWVTAILCFPKVMFLPFGMLQQLNYHNWVTIPPFNFSRFISKLVRPASIKILRFSVIVLCRYAGTTWHIFCSNIHLGLRPGCALRPYLLPSRRPVHRRLVLELHKPPCTVLLSCYQKNLCNSVQIFFEPRRKVTEQFDSTICSGHVTSAVIFGAMAVSSANTCIYPTNKPKYPSTLLFQATFFYPLRITSCRIQLYIFVKQGNTMPWPFHLSYSFPFPGRKFEILSNFYQLFLPK